MDSYRFENRKLKADAPRHKPGRKPLSEYTEAERALYEERKRTWSRQRGMRDQGIIPSNQRLKAGYERTVRAEAIAAYGGRCACCGESEAAFLVIDHKNGGGTAERVRDGLQGQRLLYHLRRQGWPTAEHQLLCHNCNHGKRLLGGCPHQLL